MKRLTKKFFDRFRLGDTGFLDSIEHTNHVLHLTGWAVCKSEAPYSCPERIYVVYADQHIGEISNFTVSRPDVVDVHSLFPEKCGFDASIQFNCDKFNPLLLELFSLSSAGYIYQLHKNQKHAFLFQLEPTGVCNLRCAQCPNTVYSGFNNRDITNEDIELCQELIQKSSTICYDGFGEFFMSKNIYEALHSTPLRTHVLVHSNGMLLDKYIETVLENSPPLRQIIISLDSLREDRYNIIRKGGDLKHIVKNMFELKKQRDIRGQKLPYIVPNMKLMNINFDELTSFIDFAAEFDGYLELVYLYDALKLTGQRADGDSKDILAYEKQQPRFNSRKIAAEIDRAIHYAQQKHVQIIWSGACPEAITGELDDNDYIGTRRPIKECPMADCSTAMQLDGKIMFCVWQTSPLFNWREEKTIDLTQHPRAIRARTMIHSGIIPYECSGACCQFVGRELSTETREIKDDFFSGGWQCKVE